MSSGQVRVRVPAKINIELRIGGVRPDGYHDLATAFLAVSLHDELSVHPAEHPELILLGGAGIVEGVPLDGDNLALRAARLLAERTGVPPGVRIELRKQIPVAGGMAGGSADAAAALLACDELWHTGLSRAELLELAAELGSDVPFCLLGGAAIGSGRGERLTPMLSGGPFWWVVLTAGRALSTPAVYAELDRQRAGRVLPEPRVDERLLAAVRSGSPRALAPALANDLQEAACALDPQLAPTLAAARAAGALAALVSGSGPTVVALAEGEAHARAMARELAADHLDAIADDRRVLVVRGPVPGARVLQPSAGGA